MTEPHMIRIDSHDLRDLIDERERLQSSLADCAREAMNSSDEWRDEVNKANSVITDLRVFQREIQEALGYDQADLIAPEELVADIRRLVEQQLATSARSDPWRQALAADVAPFVHTVTGPVALGSGLTFSNQDVPADTDQPAETAGIVPEVDVYAQAAHALKTFVGWADFTTAPPAAPQPRTWKAGDPEPSAAGPTAVWGVTTEIGDLYRPQADEERGHHWAGRDGMWWTWGTMLAAGPVTEAFPPSPEPRTDAVPAVDEPAVDEQPAEQ